MKKILIFLTLFFLTETTFARKICKPPIIKSENEIKKKLKQCDVGDKLLLFFDVKLRSEDLILNLCNLEHTIITRDEINIVHKRGSGITIICIYEPSENLKIN